MLEVGKIENNVLLPLIAQKLYGNGYDVAIEMIAGMGMTVGQEVFDTCVWIGRFWQTVLWQAGYGPTRTKEYLRNRKFMRSKFGTDIQEI